MSLKSYLPKSVRDQIFEEEPSTTKPPLSRTTFPSSASPAEAAHAMAMNWTPSDAAVPGTVPDDRIYQLLLQHTDPEQLPNLQRVLAAVKPLETVLPDRALRLRAACAQAQANGVTSAAILADIEKLFALLQGEQQKFEAGATDRTRQQVTDKEEQAAQVEKEIANGQEQLRGLRVEIEKNKAQLASTQTIFAGALARRRTELEQFKAEWSTIVH